MTIFKVLIDIVQYRAWPRSYKIIDGLIHRLTQKKLQHFVLWWFYVRLGAIDNIIKVGHNWSMGRCPISKMTVFDLQDIFLHFYPRFQLQYFTWKCYQWCWIIPYTISRACTVPLPLLVLHLLYFIFFKFLYYQNLQSRFGIERHPCTKCRIDRIPGVCMYVCVCNYSSQTTEPICIKTIPANTASDADSCRLLRFEIFTPPYL